MQSVVITGANRGIGLALSDAYLERGWSVTATCRNPDQADALHERAARHDLSIARLDVADGESIETFCEAFACHPLDVLVNNAGIYRRTSSLVPFDRTFWRDALVTNVLGAMHLTALMLPALRLGSHRKIVAVSSALGSLTGTTGGSNAYRCTKAALNMGMRTLSQELREERFTVVAISPGVVDTELARDVPGAKLTPQESAEAVVNIIGRLGPDDSGRFLRHSGEELPW